MLDSSIGHLLQNGSVLVDISHCIWEQIIFLDEKFYGNSIFSMSKELKKIRNSRTAYIKRNGYGQKSLVVTDHQTSASFSLISLLSFIDDNSYSYGSGIHSYKEELKQLGVTTDFKDGVKFVAAGIFFPHDSSTITPVTVYALLDSLKKLEELEACVGVMVHSLMNFETISRIYNYLSEFKWEPVADDSRKIWIPRGPDDGEWVDSDDRVFYDGNNLFGEKLNVLEKFKYEKKTLDLFANTFNAKVHPLVDDYCKLWKNWESSRRQITNAECYTFWEFVVRNWNSKTEETFKNNLSKLPVLDPTSDGIFLFDKCDVFVGDDLLLTDLFQSCSRLIFVWYPQPAMNFLTRNKLVDIYTKLGVTPLSESARRNIGAVDHVGLVQVNPREKIIKKGLFKLILGFLADPRLKLDTERRHEAVGQLLAVEVFETLEPPMTVGYSGDVFNVKDTRMIWWGKNNSKLLTQKMDTSRGFKNVMEYACHFGEVIADGVLWEDEKLVPQLSELIRLGFLVLSDDKAVDFLMKTKNLHFFLEDQDYLSSIFLLTGMSFLC
ncbi:hypothetical protein L1987_80029 [Smallanthus sonchifolius]|uniref:Uncharacterized protein n=1 Tax=Smallanthus sonchifolius TaxID=185202 RepID=A0ACB8YKT8_9ASTR|nr:hypothetical protein L1987_80029 [Smallanthus sonchifolius]